MTEPPPKRGRPREFDPAIALARAGKTFLREGYAATSLDTLARAMDLNKPSLYAAFGDKHALFMRVLEARYRMVATRYEAAFSKGKTLEDSLRKMLEEAVEVCLGEGGPPGCPIIAAVSDASLVDEEIGAFTRQFRAQTDKGLAKWIRSRLARERGTSADVLARLTNAVLHDIALRARIGEPRAQLREIAKDSAKVLARAAGAKE
jgi:TetR/AcrR family transcriptional regulator, copper-responsive repressor